nr:DUF2147 domain-containing protein [uncultured Undibacterium sp.]
MNRVNISRLMINFGFLMACVLPSFVLAQATSKTLPVGHWITSTGNFEVEVAKCGVALCGTVTRVLGNRSMMPGAQSTSSHDAQSALGMTLLKDFTLVSGSDESSSTKEWKGKIFNRENGKDYNCLMSVEKRADGVPELVLRIYVGLPLFGKTQRWQFVESKETLVKTN